MITRSIFRPATGLLLISVISGFGQQHPQALRTPSLDQVQRENASARSTQAAQVTTADISAGIKKDIGRETKKARDKKFRVNYQGKDLALDLIKVHEGRLANLGNGKYFACVDMKGSDGATVYDIDFFMTGQPGAMKVTETSVHKINGKAVYNWKEENGVWKKVAKS